MKSFKLIIIVVAVVALFLLSRFLPLKSYTISALAWVETLGALGPAFVVLFYTVAALFLVPGSLLTLSAGFLFGVPIGVVTVWLGATLGALAAFTVGRLIASDWVARKTAQNKRFETIAKAVDREGFKIVLLLRLSPVFPYNFLNYGLSLTGIAFGKYALATMIGMIPAICMYVYFGSLARSLTEIAAGEVGAGRAGTVFFWFGLAATTVAAVFAARVASKALRAAQTQAGDGAEFNPPADLKPEIRPEDEHNLKLRENVHPPTWNNPAPSQRYNLVVIGAGTAGLVTAAGAAGLGAKVALIERGFMGGDCLNVGCVPSKSLIASAKVAAEIRRAWEFGIKAADPEVDFPTVMERMRRIRAEISAHDSVARFEELGVDVFLGQAWFEGPNKIMVGGESLEFSKAVIATGARAATPRIPGIAEAGYLTNETVFSLTTRPAAMAIIGAGPIGCEMAQAFQRLGVQVYLLHKNDRIMDKEDPEAAKLVQNQFVTEGIQLLLSVDVNRVESAGGKKVISIVQAAQRQEISVDEILVGVGRVPNTHGLNLEAAGVDYDKTGVIVSDYLQTSNPDIYAAGDICMRYKFTHAADAAARLVIQNALFRNSAKLSALHIPWCTYTDPEIAHVGMYEKEAGAKGVDVQTFTKHFSEVDRAQTDSKTVGFAKVHVVKGTDKILGATIVGSNAGDLISQITSAMAAGKGLKFLAGVIHPYPTLSEIVRKTGDEYSRTRLTPRLKKMIKLWLKWFR